MFVVVDAHNSSTIWADEFLIEKESSELMKRLAEGLAASWQGNKKIDTKKRDGWTSQQLEK